MNNSFLLKKRAYILFLLMLFTADLLAQQKPNVILIVADDLGVNALNCYGNKHVESPEIDKLFETGTHFSNGYSNAPTCAPARACLMSGLSTPENKIYRVVDRYKKQENTRRAMRYLPPANDRPLGRGVGIDPDLLLLPEALKANGYVTAGFGKWHLGTNDLSMIHQGFDEAVEATKHYDFKTYPAMEDVNEGEYHADYITRKGIAFMHEQTREKSPFFLYMPYYLVHKPLEPKEDYFNHFLDLYDDSLDIETIKVLAMIKSLDESIGQLMEAIRELNVEENTIVIFTSDNGHYKTENPIFNFPYRGFKGSTFEGGIRTPYIIKWPNKIKSGRKVDEPIMLFDLYPTILELTETIRPEGLKLDGVSFKEILLGNKMSTGRKDLIWMYSNYSGYNPTRNSWRSKWVNVIQSEGWKLTEDVDGQIYFLYNLNSDPYERKELSGVMPEKVTELKEKLEQWKKENNYPELIPNPNFTGSDPEEKRMNL